MVGFATLRRITVTKFRKLFECPRFDNLVAVNTQHGVMLVSGDDSVTIEYITGTQSAMNAKNFITITVKVGDSETVYEARDLVINNSKLFLVINNTRIADLSFAGHYYKGGTWLK